MKRRIFALVTGSLLSFSGLAQENVVPCGTNEALENLHNQFPQLREDYLANQELLNNSLQFETVVENGVAQKKATYIIPVVFHILHEYGNENISDAAVYNLMEDLNEDYSATNADLSQVVSQFTSVIGNANIEFRLASLDPFGNCTNGIEHIYSHETNLGESVSKLNQWNRAHYMNVWVVTEPNSGGPIQGTLLGYATFPSSTDGSGFWTDGIVLRDWTVTSNDRTLSHEAGHYLGLLHPFNGVTNIGDPAECGDDGVQDTPPTEGSFSTCNLNLKTCDASYYSLYDSLANVQNIMDYSNCSVMFTQDQTTIMSNTLQGISGQRNILILDSIHELTGVKTMTMPQTALTVPLCVPVADFFTPDGICSSVASTPCTRTVSVGSTVDFEDASWNAVIDSRSWTFEDATPATSTSATPSVVFNSPGWKQVTLTVSNSAGSDTKSESHYIYVSPSWPDSYGPTMFNMESSTDPDKGTNLFLVENVEDNFSKFRVVDGVGIDGSKAWKLNTYFDNSQADPYTDDWFYNYRLGGTSDRLITPAVDLTYTTNVNVSFWFSYATNATAIADITETLKVYYSRNGGESWSPLIVSVDGSIVGATISGEDLVTAGYASNSDFAPTSNSQWREGTFSYSNSAGNDNRVRFLFEFDASDNASNLYIDNVNVSGTLNVQDAVLNDLGLVVYPNPTKGQPINVSFNAQDEATTFILRDAQGKVIAEQVIETTSGQVSQQLKNTENLPAACYFLEVSSGDHTTTRKVVVL